MDQVLKYYYPEKTSAPSDSPAGGRSRVTVFITGDALYSLNEAESGNIWASILSVPDIRLICDGEALDYRGISLDLLVERFPDQVTRLPASKEKNTRSFWDAVISGSPEQRQKTAQQIGWLLLSSPYMSSASENAIRCLFAALELGYGVNLFAYLDGCHTCHTGQIAGDRKNIGETLEMLAKRAAEKHLSCSIMVHRYSASSRGYQTWDDGMGMIGSSFIIRPARIRDPGVMTQGIDAVPVLLSENAGCIYPSRSTPGIPSHKSPPALQVNILITHSPYTTEYTYGGIAFAVTCAHQGIPSRVIFLEDGVLALTGEHRVSQNAKNGTLPELIACLSGTPELQFFALSPSFHIRGVLKNVRITAVKEIGIEELGSLLFPRQDTPGISQNRILFF